MIREAPKMKVGQIWKSDGSANSEGWTVKVTDIHFKGEIAIVNTETIEPGFSRGYKGEQNFNFDSLKENGEWSFLGWKLVEESKMEDTKYDRHLKIGQIWQCADGWKVKITGYADSVFQAETLESGRYSHAKIIDNFQSRSFEMTKEWTLVKDVGTKERPPIGTIIEINNGSDKGVRGIVIEHNKSESKHAKIRWLFAERNRDAVQDWSFPNENVDIVCIPKVRVGQFIQYKKGDIVKITGFELNEYEWFIQGEVIKGAVWNQGYFSDHFTKLDSDGNFWYKEDWKIVEDPSKQSMPPTTKFKTGTRVWNDALGEGIVTNMDTAEHACVRVRFDSYTYADDKDYHYVPQPELIVIPKRGDRIVFTIDGSEISGTFLGGEKGGYPIVYVDKEFDISACCSWSPNQYPTLPKLTIVKNFLEEEGYDVREKRYFQLNFPEVEGFRVIEPENKETSQVDKEFWDNIAFFYRLKNTEVISHRGSFGQTFKGDLKNALWRTGATQLTNAVQSSVLAILHDRGMKEDRLTVVREMIDTPVGAVFIRALLGYAITYMPVVKEDLWAQRLAEELRVSAMDRGAEEVIGTVFQYLMPAVQVTIAELPPIETVVPKVVKPKKKRVASPRTRVDSSTKAKEEVVETSEKIVEEEKLKLMEVPT